MPRFLRSHLPPALAEALDHLPDPRALPDTKPRQAAGLSDPAATHQQADADAPAAPAGPTPPTLLSLDEAAAWLSVSKSTVKRLLDRGDLVAIRVGRRRKISADTLADYLRRGLADPIALLEACRPELDP
jgi:excisionase family DNA binding protein